MKPIFSLTLATLALAGCPPQAGGGGGPAANFTLSCHSASTSTSRNVHCMRTDTRTGDIQHVSMDKIPVSNGATASAAGPAGRYQTSCVAAASDNQADFYCVRLNAESGELMMVNLSKVPPVP